MEGGWVRAKIFKTRVTEGDEGYVGVDRLGPRSLKCKERPRLAARACAPARGSNPSSLDSLAWPGQGPNSMRRTWLDAIGSYWSSGARLHYSDDQDAGRE